MSFMEGDPMMVDGKEAGGILLDPGWEIEISWVWGLVFRWKWECDLDRAK